MLETQIHENFLQTGMMLEVQLLNARGLMNTDFFSKSDPYAIVKYGRQTQKSNVARNQGENPNWNQKLLFIVDDKVLELLVSLYDEDKLTKDDFLGHVRIPLPKLFSTNTCPPTAYPVVLPSGRFKGEVKVAFAVIPKKAIAGVASQRGKA